VRYAKRLLRSPWSKNVRDWGSPKCVVRPLAKCAVKRLPSFVLRLTRCNVSRASPAFTSARDADLTFAACAAAFAANCSSRACAGLGMVTMVQCVKRVVETRVYCARRAVHCKSVFCAQCTRNKLSCALIFVRCIHNDIHGCRWRGRRAFDR